MSDHLPESFSLASILVEQGVHHQEGLLSQNDWLKTAQSHHHETRDCEPPWQSSSPGFLYPAALRLGALSQ